jgi:hypothetical protein
MWATLFKLPVDFELIKNQFEVAFNLKLPTDL